MSWIPKLMLYYQGERVAFADIFLLDKPLLTGDYIGDNFTVSIVNKNENYIYFYTLDGSNPNKNSPIYVNGIVVDNPCQIKIYATDGINKSPIIIYNVEKVQTPVIYG